MNYNINAVEKYGRHTKRPKLITDEKAGVFYDQLHFLIDFFSHTIMFSAQAKLLLQCLYAYIHKGIFLNILCLKPVVSNIPVRLLCCSR